MPNMPLHRARINRLMDRAAAGDLDAFAAVASDAQDELFRLALANGLSREDAAEATQEVFLRAYAGRGGWKPGSDAMAWLCGILLNVARELHRRRRQQQRLTVAGAGWTAAADLAQQPAASGDRWEPEALAPLMQAIQRLPPRQREVISCRYLRQMSIRQTAEAMRCAEGTVKSAVSAALEQLRGMLSSARPDLK
jgi:RNA polymerase sigma-70 factor (ECF subfamily)